jgi:transposase
VTPPYLSDENWAALQKVLEKVRDKRGAKPATERQFMEEVLRLLHNEAPWRSLPRWNASYNRFRRWEREGVWRKLWRELTLGDYSSLRRVFLDLLPSEKPRGTGKGYKKPVQARLSFERVFRH